MVVSVHEKAENGASRFMRHYVRWKFHSPRPSEYHSPANKPRDEILEFSTRPCKGGILEGRGGRGYRTHQRFDNSGDSPVPRFFSHPQPCNSKWCVLHSRVRYNIATCIRRVLHTGNYKWTKPSCQPTLPRCQIEW